MITKEQLQAMRDFEVNKALAELIYQDSHSVYRDVPSKSIVSIYVALDDGELVCHAIKDYCNTPNDIMPLQIEHRISLIKDHDSEQYYACAAFDDRDYDFAYRLHECYDDSPLRAIACCLILVLQEKQK